MSADSRPAEPRVGRRFEHGATDSTSERAFSALAQGTARHGDVHLADSQSAGRGRLGRNWVSPAGEGLYLSMILLPASLVSPVAMTMAGGLAVLDALGALGLRGAELDWPNDVTVGAAKLCGVLVETRGLKPQNPHYVIGVGINVAQSQFPKQLMRERAVTSLALEGLDVHVSAVADALIPPLLTRCAEALEGHAALARDYLIATGLMDTLVEVTWAKELVAGRLCALDVASGLTLELTSGEKRVLPLEHVRSLDRI